MQSRNIAILDLYQTCSLGFLSLQLNERERDGSRISFANIDKRSEFQVKINQLLITFHLSIFNFLKQTDTLSEGFVNPGELQIKQITHCCRDGIILIWNWGIELSRLQHVGHKYLCSTQQTMQNQTEFGKSKNERVVKQHENHLIQHTVLYPNTLQMHFEKWCDSLSPEEVEQRNLGETESDEYEFVWLCAIWYFVCLLLPSSSFDHQ